MARQRMFRVQRLTRMVLVCQWGGCVLVFLGLLVKPVALAYTPAHAKKTV